MNNAKNKAVSFEEETTTVKCHNSGKLLGSILGENDFCK
jgi:hypothetical protein